MKNKTLRGPKALKARPMRKEFSRKSFKDSTYDKPKKVRQTAKATSAFSAHKSRNSYAAPKPGIGRREARGAYAAKKRDEHRFAMQEEGSRMNRRGPAPRDFASRENSRFERTTRTAHQIHEGRGHLDHASHSPRFGKSAHFSSPRKTTAHGSRFKKDFIDESRYINKAVNAEVEKYVPQHVFTDFAIDPRLAANIAALGYKQPTPIQDQAIPVALTRKDVIGIAATGTGKTAAFLVPLIHMMTLPNSGKLLVLTPTRELAQQAEASFQELTQGMHLYSVSCVGGAPIYRQIRELRQGVHAVIGTPGRVKDLMLQGKINLKNYAAVVLDEADRMLDMGFIDDMKFILGEMPEEHQSLFFSATFSPEIHQLCSRFLRAPVTIQIKSRDTAASVEQNVVRVEDEHDKIMQLTNILRGPDATKVLIFREMKRHVDGLAESLQKSGFKVLALHGDMRNRERERAIAALASGDIQAVIATDVAARGIDIKDITLVVNYDLPNDYDTYIHRIGRTGRADKSGRALTFVPMRKPARR